MLEDNTYVVKGFPSFQTIPDTNIGKLIYDKLITNCTESEALIDVANGKSISYKQLLAMTCSWAESLSKLGYGRNTVVSICSANSTEFLVATIATLYIGGIVAPINHNYIKSELIHSLSISKPKLVLCSHQVLKKLLDVKEEFQFQLLTLDSNDSHVPSIVSLTSRSSPLYRFGVFEGQPGDATAFILCSSGTTGLAKGVMLTHRNLVTKFVHNDDPRILNQDLNRCTCSILPFFHSYGLFSNLNSIYKLAKIVILNKFDQHLFLKSIEKYKITTLPLVPPLAIFIAKSPLVDQYDLSSVREVSCGAAPLSKKIEEIIKKRLKNTDTVRQGYGLTETTLGALGMPCGQQRFGSSGKVLPYMLCKVRDPETKKSLGPNQIGEICFKGPLIMKGYYNNTESTKNAFTSDGWFLTGDLGYYDEEEYFFIVDRLKELIKYKGFQVAPAELEALLLTNPKIKDVGVVGVSDEEAGELPLAFVVPNPGSNLTQEGVVEFVAAKVSSHKRLRGGVIFVEEIPKSLSGKILRRTLREMLQKHKSKL